MNYVTYAELVIGKPALKRIAGLITTLGDDLALWLEGDEATTLDVKERDGYLVLTWAGKEGAFSEAARLVKGFALETGPDSGGEGWVTNGKKRIPLRADTLAEAAELYEEWRKNTPPIGEGALAVFKEALAAGLAEESAG